MVRAFRLQSTVLAVLTAFAESTLREVDVQPTAERADGPVPGYRATRSSTFTRTDTPLKEVPASITVVPSGLMKDQAMQGMADVLRYVPGVTVHQGEGNRDVRDDAQVFRDLYNLERVEVLKGPGGMMFGRGGAGGVVNRVTKKPVFGRVAEASLTGGGFGQARGTVDLGARRCDGARRRRRALRGQPHRRPRHPLAEWPPFETGRGTFSGNADQSHARSTVDALSAVLEHELGRGLQFRNSFHVTHYDKFYRNVFPGSAVNAAGTMSISAYNNANDRTNFFNQSDFVARLDALGVQHTVLAGVELGHQDSENQRRTGLFGTTAGSITGIPASNPVAVATGFDFRGGDANNRVKSDILGVYAQDQVALTKTFKVLAGLRYDVFKVDTDLRRTDREFSPRLGVVWTPDARSTYYASYSYAFLPSGEQLGLAPSTSDLAPEKSTNYEVGARWDVLPQLTLSAAVFRLDKDNVRSRDPAGTGLFVKTGQQRTQGVELGLQGEVTPAWRVFAGYAHLDAKVRTALNTGTDPNGTPIPAGRRIALVPRNMRSRWNRVELGGGWAAALGLIHQGASYASISNAVKLPAFTRADAAVSYTFAGGKTRVALNVENLTDRKYYPTADGDNNISPGAPRTARVTVTTAF